MQPSTKRFDHIDDHFCGRNTEKRSISDWKHLETELSASGSTPSSDKMETPKSSPEHQATARVSPSKNGRLVVKTTKGTIGDDVDLLQLHHAVQFQVQPGLRVVFAFSMCRLPSRDVEQTAKITNMAG
ncbi:hypothetical protein HYQ45_011318 [Verticillium longisporum]|uniref:Uncharacterized protein n=1 Tax=Verticillium longisporum TaxID=100787 RepID=A0A8I2ZGS7_VERLO|nr:hypothetical protein HYQ45_011318 [Verticillium longisporum]